MKLTDFGANITLITPNQRLSAYLREQYNLEKQAHLTLWPSLDCLPLASWISRVYRELTDPDLPLLLSDAQALILWEKIIAQSLTELTPSLLFSSSKLAHTAYQAWCLLQQWQVPLSLLAEVPSEETQIFLVWAQKFEQYCQQHQQIESSRCVDLILQHFKANLATNFKKSIVLAGFDETPPQTQQLFSYLSQQTQVRLYDPSIEAQMIGSLALANLEEELTAMAQWTYEQLSLHPHSTIACVVPDLEVIRDKVQRAFMQVYAPSSAALMSTKFSVPFNISAGESFSAFPLIHSALQILSLEPSLLSRETISFLLCCPFIGGAETEKFSRSQLDVLLRHQSAGPFTLSAILTFAQHKGLCPGWVNSWGNFLTILERKASQSPSAWARHFSLLLHSLGWPGSQALNSDEYQQMERWKTLLEEFASIELVDAQINHERACHYLNHLANTTLFQSKSNRAPIQVLGVLEAAGQHFDQLWVMGMNDHLWPQIARPNPFIPMHLQRHYNMPHACAQRELEFSRRLTQRFCHSAKRVIFSYRQLEGDLPLMISPLIRSMDKIMRTDILSSIHQTTYPVAFEYYLDEWGPAIAPGKVRGGATTLKDQAACPFRAFAKTRLGASTFPANIAGLSPQVRGALLHEILENLWGKLTDQATLLRQSPQELENLILETVNSILQTYAAQALSTLKPQFMVIESRRLRQLIKEWFELEKQRPPFQVLAREAICEIHIANLQFKLRIDRIDQLEDGTAIIIDYKTGQPHIEDWFGARANDPQLPLYCLSEQQSVSGLLFAQIRSGESMFKGIAAEDIGIVGVKTIAQQTIDPAIKNWDAFKNYQRIALSQLAQQFQLGFARADPVHAQKTCLQCDLQMLCRVQEK